MNTSKKKPTLKLAALAIASLLAIQPAFAVNTYKALVKDLRVTGPVTTPGEGDTGTGTPETPAGDGVLTPSTNSINLGSARVNQTAAGVYSVRFDNFSAFPVTVAGAAMLNGTSQFNYTDGCAGPIAPQGFCTVNFSFRPLSAATLTNKFILDASGGPYLVYLEGVGWQAVADSNGLNFSAAQLAGTSTTGQLPIQNLGNGPLTITGVTMADGGADFSVAPGCSTVASNSSCSLTVTFHPVDGGTRTGTVRVTHDGLNGELLIPLTGAAEIPNTSLALSQAFPSTQIGYSSSATATLTNNGNVALGISGLASAAVTGAGFSFTGSTCASTLAAHASCTVSLNFNATTLGSTSGALSVAVNGVAKQLTLSADTVPLVTVSSMSPVSNTAGALTSLAVSGQNFLEGMSVSLPSGATPSTVAVTSTQISAQLPPMTVGTYPVYVTFKDSRGTLPAGNLNITPSILQWNEGSAYTYSNGNQTVTNPTTADKTVSSNASIATGKRFFELTASGNGVVTLVGGSESQYFDFRWSNNGGSMQQTTGNLSVALTKGAKYTYTIDANAKVWSIYNSACALVIRRTYTTAGSANVTYTTRLAYDGTGGSATLVSSGTPVCAAVTTGSGFTWMTP